VRDEEKKYEEDELFNEEVVKLVEYHHDLKYLNHRRWVKVMNFEVDVLATFETPERRLKRVVVFELKKGGNWEECISQAFERMVIANYTYAVLEAPRLSDLVSFMIDREDITQMLRKGVGVVAHVRSVGPRPLLVHKARFRPASNLLSYCQ